MYRWRRERHGRVRKGADVDWENRDKVEGKKKVRVQHIKCTLVNDPMANTLVRVAKIQYFVRIQG